MEPGLREDTSGEPTLSSRPVSDYLGQCPPLVPNQPPCGLIPGSHNWAPRIPVLWQKEAARGFSTPFGSARPGLGEGFPALSPLRGPQDLTWLLHKHLTQWPALEATKSPEERERR